MPKTSIHHFLMEETTEGWGGKWLWPSRIPHRKATIVSGSWGSGKSRSLASILTSWIRHEDFPDGTRSDIEPGRIVIVTTESEDDELIDTFKAHGMDSDEMHEYIDIYTGIGLENGLKEPFDIDLHKKEFEDHLADVKPKVVIFDPLVEFHHRKEIDSHQIRELMTMLNSMCQRFDCTMICILHWNKNEKLSSGNRLAGSHQYAASVKSMITVMPSKKDLDIHYFIQEKHNLGPRPTELVFRFGVDGYIEWEKVEGVPVTNPKDLQAQQWLLDNLITPMTPQACEKLSQIPRATLYRAKGHLGYQIESVTMLIEGKPVVHWVHPAVENSWGLVNGLSTEAPK